MILKDLASIRLCSQQITDPQYKTVKELVNWMGALQAQDYVMSKWALGVRMPHLTNQNIEDAMDRGEVLRTHLLRPTWHLVSADDITWMIDLTAPHVKSSLNARNKNLELTESIYAKSNKLIEKALYGGKHLTREELMEILKKENIITDEQRASHLMLRAELDKVVCSGKTKGNSQTYALFSERVFENKSYPREEALVKLAHKYFPSHGPATLQDFIWWSGLPTRDARHALESIKSQFTSERVGEEIYWWDNSFSVYKEKSSIHLLPAFDEFIISYKDRTATLSEEHNSKAVANNGIFRPVIVVDGQVVGLWKRAIKKNKVLVETAFFQKSNQENKRETEKKAELYARFLDKEIEIKHLEL